MDKQTSKGNSLPNNVVELDPGMPPQGINVIKFGAFVVLVLVGFALVFSVAMSFG